MNLNYDKKLDLAFSNSKILWRTNCVVFFCMIFIFTACKKENHPSLEVVNQYGTYTITSACLVGYEFNNLQINAGESQKFILENGMPGGYSDINVTVSYRTSAVSSRSSSTKVNFSKGGTTKVTLVRDRLY